MRIDGPTRFGLIVLLGYVAIAWAARFDTAYGAHNASIAYPFDTYSMYAGVPVRSASAILVRDAEGTVERVSAFRSFQCEATAGAWREHCAVAGAGLDYLDDDAEAYVRAHSGQGGEPVEIIRRTWTIPEASEPVRAEDCVIVACEATR
jgi:hypothetical protein